MEMFPGVPLQEFCLNLLLLMESLIQHGSTIHERTIGILFVSTITRTIIMEQLPSVGSLVTLLAGSFGGEETPESRKSKLKLVSVGQMRSYQSAVQVKIIGT